LRGDRRAAASLCSMESARCVVSANRRPVRSHGAPVRFIRPISPLPFTEKLRCFSSFFDRPKQKHNLFHSDQSCSNPYAHWYWRRSRFLRSSFSSLQQGALTTGYTISENGPEEVLSKPRGFGSTVAFFARHCISPARREFHMGVELTKFFPGRNA
jgi:hypothetical protein